MKELAIAGVAVFLLSACGQTADNTAGQIVTDSTTANQIQLEPFESADGRFLDVRGKVA